MRNAIFGLAIWLAFVGAAGTRYAFDQTRTAAIPQVLQTLFSQVQATELVSIPRRKGNAIAGYDMVKARFAVNAAIRDPDATAIKPMIIDAIHAYFYESGGDRDGEKALNAYVSAAVAEAFGPDMLQDLAVSSRFSAIKR
jgi:hypothetical protein